MAEEAFIARSCAESMGERVLRWLRSSPALLVWAGAIGFLGALVTVAFREAILGVQWLLSGRIDDVVAIASGLAWWQRLLLPALGGLLAGYVLYAVRRPSPANMAADYIEAISAGHGRVDSRVTLVRSVSSLLSIGSGASIGREGAMVQLAAWTGSICARVLGPAPASVRILAACGAAAGMASAYNAPIAGALFVAELVLGSIDMRYVAPLVFASVVANATVHLFFGYAPVYAIPPITYSDNWELVLFVALGALLGLGAPLFMRLIELARRVFRGIPAPLYVRLCAGGAVVGLVSLLEPRVWGNGYSVVSELLHRGGLWHGIAVLLVLKIVATAASAGSGAVGGVFTPSLFIGAMAGQLFGQGIAATVSASPPEVYAIVGMGAFLAGMTQAPLMSILMIFEMTLDYSLVLPLMLACVTAHYVAAASGGESMYAHSLRRLGQNGHARIDG